MLKVGRKWKPVKVNKCSKNNKENIMLIADMLSEIEEGQNFKINLDVTIGSADVTALKLLSFLYKEMIKVDGDANYYDLEKILTTATWWHVTFNTLVDEQDLVKA